MTNDFAIIAAFLSGCLTMFVLSEFYGRKVRKAEETIRKHYLGEKKKSAEREMK